MSSYWCHRCSRLVRFNRDGNNGAVACQTCDGEFVEEIESGTHSRQSRSVDRSSLNPVVILRGSGGGGGGGGDNNGFDFYYENGSGNGSDLRPVPDSMSEFLMGSGFDRLLEQLTQIEISGFGRPENPPASKAAIESIPEIEILDSHVSSDLHCAVCTEAFTVGTEAREMPCKHIYHGDCILPWLAIRNSCPVCRYKLAGTTDNTSARSGEEDTTVGLTVWRLPGGGFAVGRLNSAVGREGERILPVVFTEMDGGFGVSGRPRRVSWVAGSAGRTLNRGGGFRRRLVRGFSSFMRRFRSSNLNSESNPNPSSTSISEESMSRRSSSNSSSVFSGVRF